MEVLVALTVVVVAGTTHEHAALITAGANRFSCGGLAPEPQRAEIVLRASTALLLKVPPPAVTVVVDV